MYITIPGYENESDHYPGDIKPGEYSLNAYVQLLRDHRHDPDAVYFLADMLEE